MTDTSQLPMAGTARHDFEGETRRRSSRVDGLAPYACVLVGTALGFAVGRSLRGDTSYEPSLALLLQFMAAVKFVAVLGAAAAIQWRNRHPIAAISSRAYLCALLIMAPAPGLIFSLGAVAAGALLFHLGLFAFLVVAWKDDRLRLPTRR